MGLESETIEPVDASSYVLDVECLEAAEANALEDSDFIGCISHHAADIVRARGVELEPVLEAYSSLSGLWIDSTALEQAARVIRRGALETRVLEAVRLAAVDMLRLSVHVLGGVEQLDSSKAARLFESVRSVRLLEALARCVDRLDRFESVRADVLDGYESIEAWALDSGYSRRGYGGLWFDEYGDEVDIEAMLEAAVEARVEYELERDARGGVS